MAVSSYGSATRSSGVVRILKDLDLDLTDRHVVIVEDIVDSGLTLAYLRKNLAARGPASMEVVPLLVKEGLQRVELDLKYVGFTIPPTFVVGYGLDVGERYRNLPYVAEYAGTERSDRCGRAPEAGLGRGSRLVRLPSRLSGVAVTKLRRSVVLAVVVAAVVGLPRLPRAYPRAAGPRRFRSTATRADLDNGKVATATIHDKDHTVTGKLKNGTEYTVDFPAQYTARLTQDSSTPAWTSSTPTTRAEPVAEPALRPAPVRAARAGADVGARSGAGRRQPRDGLRQGAGQDRSRRTNPRSRSPTSPGSTKRSRSSRRSRSSSSRRRSSSRWARRSRRACCCSARREPARRCSPRRSRARPGCRSSRSAAPTSSRCSSGSARRASATCSSRRRRRRRRSSSSTRSTRSAVIGVPVSVAVTTSASRRSTSCSSRWTASTRSRA